MRPKKGKILAVKWGLNPNSSSLGVDVTFLLFGSAVLSLGTPLVASLARLSLARNPKNKPDSDQISAKKHHSPDNADEATPALRQGHQNRHD